MPNLLRLPTGVGFALCCLLLPTASIAQSPAIERAIANHHRGKPPFDPNDPEGLVTNPGGLSRYAWKRAGTWTVGALTSPSSNNFPKVVPNASPAEHAQMKATLDGLTPILRATTEGAHPIGYFMKESRTFFYRDPYSVPQGILAGSVPLGFATAFFPFYIADTLINGKFVQDKAGETESISFRFNQLPSLVKQPIIVKEQPRDTGGEVLFYQRPKTTGTLGGFPVLDGDVLLITRAGRDPWTPALYGRVLKLAVAALEKDRLVAENRLDGYKKTNTETQAPAYEQKMRDSLEKNYGNLKTSAPHRWATRLASMERELAYNRDLAARRANPQHDKDGNWYWNPIEAHAEAAGRLAALTPADAAKPACYLAASDPDGRYDLKGTIHISSATTDPKCEPVVTDNYSYFDPKLPRSAPQILTVGIGRCGEVLNGKFVAYVDPRVRMWPPQGCMRHAPIWQEMDWSKVAALLVP